MSNIIEYNLLNYADFRKAVVEGLSGICGSEFNVREVRVEKNNSTILFGVSIKNKDCNIAPTIYLEQFHERYIKGEISIEEVKNEIIRIYKYHRDSSKSIDVDFFKDFGAVREKLGYRLVNYDRNKDFLEKVPHRKFLDLAVIYSLNMNECGGSITIRNEHMDVWNVNEDELFEIAKKNTPDMFELNVSSFTDMIRLNLSGRDDVDEAEIDDLLDGHPVEMYILTNEKCMYGATCLLYENALKDFAEKMDSDLYLLPSSVHEMIMIADRYGMQPEKLSEMVRNVNEAVVEREDYLSDHVYYYDRNEAKLKIVS